MTQNQPKPLITKPGVYDLTLEQYADQEPCPEPSISSHGLRMILNECPSKYWWDSPMNPEREPIDKDVYRIGRAAHYRLLEPHLFEKNIHVMPEGVDFRSNAAKAQRDAAVAEGKTVIKYDAFLEVQAMEQALRAHSFVPAAFENGEPEKTLAWKDPETGVWLRCRPDFLPKAIRHVPDYKTAASAKPEQFRKHVWDFGYHMQAALYMDGIEAVTDTAPQSFFFVVQEKKAPYVVSCIALDPVAIEWGRIQNRKAIRIFADCLAADRWPGYADDVVEVELPVWAERELQRQHEAGRFDVDVPK